MEYEIFTSLEEAKENGIEKVIDDVYSLWQDCFGDSSDYTDFYFQWVVPYNRIFTLYKGDTLCSMLHLNPYTLSVKENEVKADYIVGVATRKEERKKGYMGLLINKAFERMYEEEKPFTYLMPAAEAIYYPYDFRKVYTEENWIQKMKEAAANADGREFGNMLIKLTASDRRNRRILTKFTEDILKKDYNIYALRSRKYYEKLLAEMTSAKGGILLIFKGDKPIGYAAYMQDDGFKLAECICRLPFQEEVLLELYREFSFVLPEKEDDFEASIMMRIVNLKAFLLNLRSEREFSLVIEARDEKVPENNAIFSVTISKDRCIVTDSKELPVLKGDIADLTLLFFGILKKENIKELILTENKESILEDLAELQIGSRLFLNEIV